MWSSISSSTYIIASGKFVNTAFRDQVWAFAHVVLYTNVQLEGFAMFLLHLVLQKRVAATILYIITGGQEYIRKYVNNFCFISISAEFTI